MLPASRRGILPQLRGHHCAGVVPGGSWPGTRTHQLGVERRGLERPAWSGSRRKGQGSLYAERGWALGGAASPLLALVVSEVGVLRCSVVSELICIARERR